MNAGIVAQGLRKNFGSFTAVDDVSFTAEEGKITAILGPSGSGKSTVLRLIAGLEAADTGRIWLDGEDQTGKRVQDRRFGFVFQHYALFRHMSVRDNIEFGPRVRGESAAIRRKRANELMDLVQLAPFADRYPDQLSGGQRQRVALARALATRPKVLLLDEPFGALDAKVRLELRAWLDELHRELAVTSLLVTHDQEEALELAHRVVVMDHGRVQQIGSPADLYKDPATAFVAGFLGAASLVRGRVVGGRLAVGAVSIANADHLPEGAAADAFVRPQYVEVSLQPGPAGASIPASVTRSSDLGWLTKLHLRLEDGQKITAEIATDAASGIVEGSTVHVQLRNVRVFQEPAARSAPVPPQHGVHQEPNSSVAVARAVEG